jgi:ketosteroid isomerase-like protein
MNAATKIGTAKRLKQERLVSAPSTVLRPGGKISRLSRTRSESAVLQGDRRICYPCSMYELTKDALGELERIHSNWIGYEVAGDIHSLMALCADDIELWPPDAQPLLGRAAVSAQMAREKTTLHSVEITDRRIRGSNEIAYLTASYRTTFSSAEDSTCRQALGSHLWMMQKRTGTWVVTLVSWSVWGSADTSATSQPSLFPGTEVTS